jgi:hypothetical protein
MADAAGGAAAASAAGVLSTAWKNAMATVGSAKLFQFVKSAPGGQSAPVVGDTVLSTYAGLVHIDTDDGKLVVTCAGLPLDTGGVCNKKTNISDGLTMVATSNLLNHLRSVHALRHCRRCSTCHKPLPRRTPCAK